jgi:hypothetical protein
VFLDGSYDWSHLPIGLLSLGVGVTFVTNYRRAAEQWRGRLLPWARWVPGWVPFWRYGWGGLCLVSGFMLVVQ